MDPTHAAQAVELAMVLESVGFPVALMTGPTEEGYRVLTAAMADAGLDPAASEGPILLYQGWGGARIDPPAFVVAVDLPDVATNVLGFIRIPAQTTLEGVADQYKALGLTLAERLGPNPLEPTISGTPCGATVVLERQEGYSSHERWCPRIEGPCPFPGADPLGDGRACAANAD